jgi:hypothetical protein
MANGIVSARDKASGAMGASAFRGNRHMKRAGCGLIVALGLLTGLPALGQQHETPKVGQHPNADRDMMAGMEKMSRDMANAPMTGNADRDFVAMMIPHHQGAIDMARVQLRDGKDPALRRLATEIVAAQEKEIAMMKQWQAAHPAP